MNLFPTPTKPYFIATPPYTHTSSGVRALHLLCHSLNESGYRAYLFPLGQSSNFRNRTLNTPMLDYSDPEAIVIYPEIVNGNPLGAKKVVRWILGPRTDLAVEPTDMIIHYTKNLGPNVLCIPTFDPNIFYPPVEGAQRWGSVFYANKYRGFIKSSEYPGPFRKLGGSWENVADMLRGAQVCYVFERTEVSVLAKMCGCEVVSIATDVWDGQFPEEFINTDGSLIPQETLMINFKRQLGEFIERTQSM